jgi:hypothetical protein
MRATAYCDAVPIRRYALAGKNSAGRLARIAGLFSVVALLTTGCGGGDGDPLSGGSTRGGLTGTWLRSSIEASGRNVSCPNSLVVDGLQIDSCVRGETLVLRNDGTYSITYPAPKLINLATESGTYSFSNNILTLKRLTSSFDTNGDGFIGNGETTTLSLVTNSSSIPTNPQQRVSYTVVLDDRGLTLTPIQTATANASGETIVNSDGTVNSSVADATSLYIH